MKRLSFFFFFLFPHTLIFAQQYIADSKSGCKIWDVAYDPTHKVTWTGKCAEGLASGKGILTWFIKDKEAARYTGGMSKGFQNGYGIFSYTGAKSIKGYFVDGEVTGLDSLSIKLLKKNPIVINDSTHIFDNFLPDKSLFYYTLAPKGTVKGALVLLPSTWERPESVLNNNTKICRLALNEGLVIIVPSTNMHICLDQPVIHFLDLVFNNAMRQYHIPKDKFVIGGYSLGGIISLRYTEIAFENHQTAIVPAVVYSVDGPVDFANMYHQFEREIEKNVSAMAVNEARYYLDGMHKYFNGTPAENPAGYTGNSVYSRSEKQGGNAKFLRNVPLRIYSDPDIDWAMKNRQRDLYDMNAPDQTAMIIELNLQGNTNAKYINALGRGYRLDGTRHPHSWSLVDPNECIKWIKANLKL